MLALSCRSKFPHAWLDSRSLLDAGCSHRPDRVRVRRCWPEVEGDLFRLDSNGLPTNVPGQGRLPGRWAVSTPHAQAPY